MYDLTNIKTTNVNRPTKKNNHKHRHFKKLKIHYYTETLLEAEVSIHRPLTQEEMDSIISVLTPGTLTQVNNHGTGKVDVSVVRVLRTGLSEVYQYQEVIYYLKSIKRELRTNSIPFDEDYIKAKWCDANYTDLDVFFS